MATSYFIVIPYFNNTCGTPNQKCRLDSAYIIEKRLVKFFFSKIPKIFHVFILPIRIWYSVEHNFCNNFSCSRKFAYL